MATFKTFEEIEGWKMGRELTREIYRISSVSPFCKDFGLSNQIRRAAVSIMSNIAEGFDRDGNKEFINFLTIAKASAAEVRSQLYVALDQKYISNEDFDSLVEKTVTVGRMLAGLIKYLQTSDIKGAKFR